LKSLDLKIDSGKTYAFVGSSGSGKTTVANLVIRMFDPSLGNIVIDDYDIKEITLKSLRSQISLVSQETVLFDATVLENIAYGTFGASRGDIIRAAQAADADVVTGVWKNGRVGTYRGLRKNKADFGAVAFGTKGIAPMLKGDGYEPMCREIAKFFKTKVAPVSPEETIEIFAFMEAADESKRNEGKPVAIKDVMAKAKAQAAGKK
jgi:ABC-type sugar transport system ATPase subunit